MSAGVLAMLCLASLSLTATSASAESFCTDTWTGPSEGEWQTASDWSAGKVPTSSDVACIGSGKTVKVTTGTNQTGVVQGEGALVISAGSLEVANALEASSITSLTVNGGILTGPAKVEVSGSLLWSTHSKLNGTMTGSGQTILKPGATGTINFGNSYEETVDLEQRSFINEGTTTFESGTIVMSEGALIKNTGTFNANSQTDLYEAEITIASGSKIAPSLVNTGTFEKTSGGGERTTKVDVPLENDGTVEASKAGALEFLDGGSSSSGIWAGSSYPKTGVIFHGNTFSLVNGTVSGSLEIAGATVKSEHTGGSGLKLAIPSGSLSIEGGSLTTAELSLTGGTLTGSGTLYINESLLWSTHSGLSGTMTGSGKTVLTSSATGTINWGNSIEEPVVIEHRTLVNEGTLNFENGTIIMSEDALLMNIGKFEANSQAERERYGAEIIVASGSKDSPLITNIGKFEKTSGQRKTKVKVPFENYGIIGASNGGSLEILDPVYIGHSTQWGHWRKRSQSACGDPVSCATGNFYEKQTDLSIGGRGVGLELTRTYNSQAGAEGIHGAFGYGWTSSFSDHLAIEKSSKVATLYQTEGNTVPFTETSEGSFVPPAWSQDTLSGSAEAGYTLTLANQTKYKFNGSSGRLESVTDRDANATILAYNEAGHLETITDPAGRKITFAYNSEGLVESAKDPMGHVVKYTYESGNLASVTEPGEEKAHWQFKYNGSHEITTLTDGRGGKTVNEYNGSNQVISQTDPTERTLTFDYEPFHTTITNHSTGSVTSEWFTSNDEPFSITRGYETSSAITETFAYNEGGYITSETNGNDHTTTYGYDSANDLTSVVDPEKDETKWTYDSTHDVETVTTPKGETTTIKREIHGNPEVVERAAPGGKTQVAKYKYAVHGEVESVTNPLEHTWKYEYDSKGDRTAEIDPEGNKRTWEYNEDSQETGTVSPRGHIKAGEEEKFRTKIERDAQGRPVKITDPLGHVTEYKYDGDGNVEKMTDGNKHTTTYAYNGDNQPIKVEAPNKAITETEYDGAGQVIAQIDGNKHKTKYKRNATEEVTEATNPLGRITTKEYDGAGNLIKLIDPAKRTTTYTYDPANRLTEVSYSMGKPATIKYEYDKDGDRTKMTDGTGTTTYTYDQLDRLTESENSHKEVIKYEYDLANDQTKITYPNEKSVTRAFDKDGRLEKITDWLTHSTKFTYNEDSDLKTMVFPSETKDEDKYTYNDGDQMTEVKMDKSSEVLASLVYTRDSDGQVKKTTSKGLPGAEVTENTYDENNRLTKSGSTEYKYDSANNPTKEGSSENTYNEGDELEKGTGVTYSYDELGERTKRTPSTGPAITYGYDQAGDPVSVERPKEGEIAEIKDSYEYNGEGLRTSQTINGTTTYLAWDMTKGVPLILDDGTNSYIYGPESIAVEQINNSTGTAHYLHHDQQGSTRLITGSAGTVEGKCTYGAYGTPTCEGTTTTLLGYDGQYTSSDTGLIYLRTRVYDPSTAQFLTVDPLVALTQAPYIYTNDNPLNYVDPSGRAVQVCVGGTVSAFGFAVEVNACYVNTPGGEGVALSGGVARGPGLGANVHAGVGASNAQTPGEYSGPFATVGGSAQAGLGGYASGFAGKGGECNAAVVGGTAGITAGVGAEGGLGVSYTEVIPF
jgi:RHS repeat-associated protein